MQKSPSHWLQPRKSTCLFVVAGRCSDTGATPTSTVTTQSCCTQPGEAIARRLHRHSLPCSKCTQRPTQQQSSPRDSVSAAAAVAAVAPAYAAGVTPAAQAKNMTYTTVHTTAAEVQHRNQSKPCKHEHNKRQLAVTTQNLLD